MRAQLAENPALDVAVLLVWLPMFPRPQERWKLPGMTEEFASSGFPQFWDDERLLSAEIKRRLVPDVNAEVPWDLFLLFDRDATWGDAEEHLLAWGGPVIEEAEALEALLSSMPE